MNSCPAKTAKKSGLKTDAIVSAVPCAASTANASRQPFAHEAANETNTLASIEPLASSTSQSQSSRSKRSNAWHFFETVAPGKAACQVCTLTKLYNFTKIHVFTLVNSRKIHDSRLFRKIHTL